MTLEQDNLNQCDGCRRGLPVEDGTHRGEGYDLIVCTKDRYIKTDSEDNLCDNNCQFLTCLGCLIHKDKV